MNQFSETPLQKLGRQMAQKRELEFYTLKCVRWNKSHRLCKKYQERFILSSSMLNLDNN